MIYEHLLSTDNFMNPKVITGTDAVGVLLVRLLILVPGTNPLHPRMGVGIGTKYRYITEDDLVDLQNEIESQVLTYLPPVFANVQVKLSITDEKYLKIAMLIDNTSYVYDTYSAGTPVQYSEN